MTSAISPFASALRRGFSRLGGTMAAFLFSLALAGCGGGGGGSGFLGDAGGNVGDEAGSGPGAGVVLGSGEGITEERRQGVAVKVAGLDLGGEGKVRAEDVQVSEDPEILNQNPFATAETAPEAVAEARGFERQSVGTERKTPGYKAFEVAVPADNPLMTVAVWISETAPEEEVELPEGKPERDPEAPRKFLYVRLQVYVSTRNFAAVEGGGVEVLETQVIAVEERLPDPKPPAGADECEAAGWKAARVDGNAINCLIPLTSGGTDFEGCVLAGEFEPLCSEVFGEDFVFPTKLEGEARYVFNCGEGMIPEGSNTIGATQCFAEAAVNCAAGSLPANGMTQGDLNVALRLAARRGDAGQVCEMLRRGAEVNDDLNGTEFTALQEAVSEGHLGVAELLLANGAEVNARKEGAGPSALDLAARAKNAEIAAVLRAAEGRCFVESGGLCEEAVAEGSCPAGSLSADGMTQAQLDARMISAAEDGDADAVCEYLRRGANIEAQKTGNLRTALMIAALDGHADVAELLINNGADVNYRGGNGGYGGRPNPGRWRDYPDSNWPALLYAAGWNGNVAVARLLLDNSANIELGDDRNRRPLWEAAFNGHLDMMELLLDRGADVNGADVWGITPLHAPGPHYGYPGDPEWPYAAEVAEYLISRGANVNALDTWGRSPLDLYAGWNHPNAAAVVREAGGRCFVETGALCEVAVAAPEPVVGTVVASDTVCAAGALSADGMTQAQLDAGLLSAAAANNMAGVCEYLRRGANVDAEGPSDTMLRETALINAAVYGRLEMARLLLNNGADVGAKVRDRGKSDMTALIYASAAGHADVVELLLDEGAEIDATDSRRRGAVYEAAHWGRLDVLELLLSRGVNAGVRDRTGETVLHGVMIGNTIKHMLLRAEEHRGNWVVFWGHTVNPDDARSWAGALEVLLTADGVEVNTRMNDGRSALDYAAEFHSGTDSGFPELAELLRDAGGRCFVRTGPLCEVAVATPEPVVSTVVASDTVCTAGSLSANGMTQEELHAGLIAAVKAGDMAGACEHLRRGADVNGRDDSGRSALMQAGVNLEMGGLLLANGAELHIRWPARAGWLSNLYAPGYPDVVEFYLSRGADPNLGWHDNTWTPLHEAAFYNAWRTMEILLAGGADPDIQTARPGWRGGAPLHYVFDGTRANSGRAVSVLVSGGAEVNARDNNGRSGLDLAARQGDADAAAILRDAGGVCFVETGPLCEVEVATSEPVVATVVTSDTTCTAGSLSANGKTQAQLNAGLISAVRADNLEDACEYLRRGANVGARETSVPSTEHHRKTGLIIAAFHEQAEMAKLLLNNGADVNQVISGRSTQTGGYRGGIRALSYAFSDPEIVKLLLDRGADVNAQEENGRTALWEAAHWGFWKSVKVLLDGGANPNLLDYLGASALYGGVVGKRNVRAGPSGYVRFTGWRGYDFSSLQSWPKVVSLLLAAGADVNAREGTGNSDVLGYRGYSSLDFVARMRYSDIAEILRNAGGRCFVRTGPLCEVAVATPEPVVSTVVASDTVCAAGSLSADGMTQAQLDAGLLSAVREDNLEDACEYLRRGASPGARETSVPSGELIRKTALIIAAYYGQVEMAKLLLNNGADVDQSVSAPGRGGIRALSFAFRDTEIVKLLLDRGADIDMQEDNGRNPLWESAHWGFWKSVKLLLDRGADPNLRDQWGASALYGGVVGKRNVGAGPNGYVRFTGWRRYDLTPLQSWPKVVSLLLATGADVNAREETTGAPGYFGYPGYSSLDFAARMRYSDIAEILRGAGGRCFVRTGPLCEVAVATPEPVVSTVVASDTVCTAGSLSADGLSQRRLNAGLISAARGNDLAGVCEYLRRGANVDAQESEWRYYKRTPLMIAATDGNLELGKLLRRNGADVNFQGGNYRNDIDSAPPSNGDRKTPALHYAAGAGHKDFVEWLLSEGADLHAEQSLGRDTLWEAAFWGRPEIVKLLLSRGGNPDNQGRWTAAPLWDVIHHATYRPIYGSPRWGIADTFPVPTQSDWTMVISLLVASGADVNLRTIFGGGESPLDMAVSRNSAKYSELMRGYGGRCFVRTGPLCGEVAVVAGDTICKAGSLSANGLTQRQLDAGLVSAAKGDNLPRACEYLRRGASADARERNGYLRTALIIAADKNFTEMAELLLTNGADPDEGGARSWGAWGVLDWAPLHYAASRGHTEIVRILLANDADANIAEGRNRRPLYEAAFHGRLDIAEMLLAAGAELDARDQWGLTAVQGGVSMGSYGEYSSGASPQALVVTMLLSRGAGVNVRHFETGESPLDFAVRHYRLARPMGGDAERYAAILRNAGGKCFVETGPLCGEAVATPEPVVGTVVASDTVCTAGSLSANGMTQAQLDAGLIAAAGEGDLTTACEYLRRGANPNGRDAHQHVPLMHAKAHLDMGELLLANGADKYVQIDGNGWWSPLFPLGGIYTAAQIEFYLSRGVDPNFGSLGGGDYDWRPLHEAAFYGKWNAIKHLLDGGAVPNVHTSRPGWRGRTPLHEAVGDSSDSFHFAIDASNPPFGMIVGNSARAVSVLLEGGAEVNARDGRGYSPLDRAAVYSKTAAAAVLRAAGGRCFVRTGPLCGEARVAVEYSSSANGTVSADVANGGEVARGATVAFTATPAEGFYVSGWTGGCVDAVAGSVGDGGAKVCSLIAEAALSVGAVFAEVPSLAGPECPGGTMPGNGLTQAELNTQLRLAARNGDTRKICEMLRRGAEVNDNLDGNEFTALQEAVSEGHKAAAEMLLANDAHVNARKGGSGPAPLDLAAQNENAEIAQILRDAHGQCFVATGPLCGDAPAVATPEPVEGTVGITVITVTVAMDDYSSCTAGSLPASGMTQTELNAGLFLAARNNDLKGACEYLRRGANIHAPDPDNQNAPILHKVASDGEVAMAKLLLDNGASVEERGNQYLMPLHEAAMREDTGVAALLIARGADIERQIMGSPLHWAAHVKNANGISLLIALGADTMARGWPVGMLPLHYAVEGAYSSNQSKAVASARLLIAGGTDVNGQRWGKGGKPDGDSALDMAAELDLADLAAVLREAGGICFTKTLPLCSSPVAEITMTLSATLAADSDSEIVVSESRAVAQSLQEDFETAFGPAPAFGDAFGAVSSGRFLTRLDSLMRATAGTGDVWDSFSGWQKENDFGRVWFSTGQRGDFGFGAGSLGGGESGFGKVLDANPFAGLSGNGMLAGGETGFGESGKVRVAAFGDYESQSLLSGEDGKWTRWAASGTAIETAMSEAERFSGLSENKTRGAMTEFHLGGADVGVALQAGAVSESESALGGTARNESLRGLRSRTAFAGLSGSAALLGTGWRLRGAAHVGRSWAESDGMLRSSDLWASAFSAGLERGGWLYSDDGFVLRFSQPLRVEIWERELANDNGVRRMGISPSGRQLDVDAAYRLPLSGGGWLLFSAGVRRDGGHSSGSGVEGGALFAVEKGF